MAKKKLKITPPTPSSMLTVLKLRCYSGMREQQQLIDGLLEKEDPHIACQMLQHEQVLVQLSDAERTKTALLASQCENTADSMVTFTKLPTRYPFVRKMMLRRVFQMPWSRLFASSWFQDQFRSVVLLPEERKALRKHLGNDGHLARFLGEDAGFMPRVVGGTAA